MLLLLIFTSAILYSSLVEYCLHRFILHRSYKEEHVKNHHTIFHGLKSYELEEVNIYDILSSVGELMRNGVLYLPPSLIIFLQNKPMGIIFLLICYLYNLWEEFLHLYFHKTSNIFIIKLRFFRNLKEHHRVHHYIYNSNYGIGTSFWDYIFKTKKK
jgi:hypothetical protein